MVTLPPRLGVFADVGTAVGAGGTVGGTLVAVGAANEELLADDADDDATAEDDELLADATADDELLDDATGAVVGATTVGDVHALTIKTSATNKKNNFIVVLTCIFPSWVLNYSTGKF